MTPHEKAVKLFEEQGNFNYEAQEFEDIIIVEKQVCKDEDDEVDCWFAIKEDGFVAIDDNANGEGAIIPPDFMEKLCKWYLGIKD